MQHDPDIAKALVKARHDDLLTTRDNVLAAREARAARRARRAATPTRLQRVVSRIAAARLAAGRLASLRLLRRPAA